MRLLLILVIAAISSGPVMSQRVIDITNSDAIANGEGLPLGNMGNEPFAVAKFVRITQGTPYFDEKWMKSLMVLSTGRAYKGLLVRLNLVDNTVIYKDASGEEKVATTPLKFIVLYDTISRTEYSFIHGSQLNLTDKALQKTWFQVLVNDKVSLCKQIRKTINDLQTYGSATTEQAVDTRPFFFVRIHDDFIPVKKWDDLQGLFADKKAQIAQFIGANHLKGKSESDYIQLVKYYNSLIAGNTTAN